MYPLEIVIPMAGTGSRFAQAGYKDPKPLIPIYGTPMIKLVIENLRPRGLHHFTFICQKAHLQTFGFAQSLVEWGGKGTTIATVDGLTDGAACTVLSARGGIDPEAPLMIANCDQYVDVDINAYIEDMERRELDGLMMTLTSSDPKWSFVSLDDDGYATRVAEKQVISPHATVGIYNFVKAGDFFSAADAMIAADDRTNGEFYVAPVYNYLIRRGRKIGAYAIGTEGNGMYGLGIPKDLEHFLTLPLSRKVAQSDLSRNKCHD